MGKHTAVLAAVVAAASLAISAWGTWKSAQVADDQLAQSRDQQDKEARSQVAHITMWAEKGGKVVLANRSLDPAGAWLEAQGKNMLVGILPPCTRIEIPMHEYIYAHLDRTRERVLVTGLLVTDVNGTVWRRKMDGSLARAELPTRSRKIDMEAANLGFLSESDTRQTALEQCNGN